MRSSSGSSAGDLEFAGARSGRRPWLPVTGVTVVAGVAAVAVTAAADGFRWGRLWVVGVGIVLIGVLERYPVAVSPGHTGRRYQNVTELGVGVLLWQTSPAALGVAVALAHVPLAVRWELSVWKRAFGIAQAVLAAVLGGVVYGWLDDVEPRVWAVVATAVMVTVVLAVPLVAIARALRDRDMTTEAVTSVPLAAVASTASVAAGLVLAQAMYSPDWALLGALGALGAAALVRASHEASMRADRMQVLFNAATQLQSSPEGTSLNGLLAQLGPLVVPGARRLEIAATRPSHGEAVRVGERGWLTVTRDGPADRPTREDRQRLELLAAVIDETARKAEEIAEAAEAAATDPLTGLLNRRGLDQAVAQVTDPATVVMIDLDGLKAINDQYGHPAGDAAITALANALRHGVRANDLVARLGGDEFVVIIVGQDPDEVRSIIERLAASANDDPDLPAGVRVRASHGMALWSPEGEATWTAAAAKADAELYASRSARGIPHRRQP